MVFLNNLLGRISPQRPPPAQQASKAKDVAKQVLDQASKAIQDKSGMVRLVVHGAKLVCDQTIPPKKINILLVPDPRPLVEGKPQANIADKIRDKNIKPWPCKCKKRPQGSDHLPCDYRPADLWKPGVSSQTVDSTLPNASKALGIAQQMMADGFSAVQASAMLGNIMVESQNLTKFFQSGGGGGRGWIQWDGVRARQFQAWSQAQGLDWTSDAANYGYLQAEMGGINGNHWTSWKGYSLDGFKQQTDLAKATDYFMNGYERPGVPHRDWRQDRAKAIKRLLDKLALPEVARLTCTYGGIISIVDPGQTTKSAKL